MQPRQEVGRIYRLVYSKGTIHVAITTATIEDGSVGTIIYTAKGSKSFSRERVDIFCEDSVAVIEDFRRGQLVKGGRTRQIKKLSMDMGYGNEMHFFFQQAAAPEQDPGLFQGLVATTRATLAAVESLRSQARNPGAEDPHGQ